MKKIVSYLLIFLFNMQSFGMNASNISSFYNLIDHYQLHQTDYNNSFNEFLDLHYGSQKEAHENEHEGHKNLPFQECQHLIHIFFLESRLENNLNIILPSRGIKHNFNYALTFTSLLQTEILQPPKA